MLKMHQRPMKSAKESHLVPRRSPRISRGAWDCAIGSCLAVAAVLHPWTVAVASGIGSAAIAVYRDLRNGALALAAFGLPARAFVVLFGVAFMAFDALEPLQAQFFGNGQWWIASRFAIDTQLTELVFNVLRALFTIHIAIRLVRVLYAVGRQEDWISIARTPLAIVVILTLTDILTQDLTRPSGGP